MNFGWFIQYANSIYSLKKMNQEVLVQAAYMQVYRIDNKLIVLCASSDGILSRVVILRDLVPVYDTQEIDNNSYNFKLTNIQKVQLLDNGLLRIYNDDKRLMAIKT